MDFHISHDLHPRPEPREHSYPYDQAPRWTALRHFNDLYHGEFEVPLEGGTLPMWLDPDFTIIFDQLPGWLSRLAEGDGEASLVFASQGTELALDATRRGDSIRMSARSIAPDQPLPAHLRPITVPSTRFLDEWARFVDTVLDAVAEVSPEVRSNPEWQAYRTRIDAARGPA